jgi:hypothetical protein
MLGYIFTQSITIILVSYYPEVPDTEDDLPEWLCNLSVSDQICVINGAVYIYMHDCNGWMPLLSARVMVYIVQVTHGYYVPVAYRKASRPYIDMILRRRWSTAIVFGNTKTQGYKRYNY